MKNRALLACAGTAIALSTLPIAASAQGDATAAARAAAKVKHPGLKECDAQSCSVSVTATACDPGSIKAVPDTLAVLKTHKGVLIVWTADSAGYTFDKKSGIVLKDASQGQFQCKARAKATEYDCFNKNENPTVKEYQYSITLIDSAGKTCKVDPIIINGY
jgi:hypothetical protein